MKLLRRHAPPPPADARPALAASRARLERDRRQVVAPLRRLNERNRVTEMVAAIVEGKARGAGAS
jgi:hypothetical protein